jgi:DNA-binding NtrC family response regulator
VRELENAVQRLAVMAEGNSVDAPDLPALMRSSFGAGDTDLRRSLAEVEASYIRRVLASVGGNKSKAAQILNIDRKTLRAKLQQHEIDSESESS